MSSTFACAVAMTGQLTFPAGIDHIDGAAGDREASCAAEFEREARTYEAALERYRTNLALHASDKPAQDGTKQPRGGRESASDRFGSALEKVRDMLGEEQVEIGLEYRSLAIRAAVLQSLRSSLLATVLAGKPKLELPTIQDVPQPEFAEGGAAVQQHLDLLISDQLRSRHARSSSGGKDDAESTLGVGPTLYKPPPPRGFGESGQLALPVAGVASPSRLEIEVIPPRPQPGELYTLRLALVNLSPRPLAIAAVFVDVGNIGDSEASEEVDALASQAAAGERVHLLEETSIWMPTTCAPWRRAFRVLFRDQSAVIAIAEARRE